MYVTHATRYTRWENNVVTQSTLFTVSAINAPIRGGSRGVQGVRTPALLTVYINLQLHVMAGGSTWSLPFLGVRDPHLTPYVIGHHNCTCHTAPKFIKQEARMWQTDDRQTTLRKNVGIGGFVCAARAIPRKISMKLLTFCTTFVLLLIITSINEGYFSLPFAS